MIDEKTFDWTTQTSLKGTVSRIGRFVRGTCAECPETDVLLYDEYDDDRLLCPTCSRKRAHKNPLTQVCDNCGEAGNVWRDPIPRKNEYLCIKCHDPSALFQNRWANKARQSKPLHDGEAKAQCAAKGYGTECKGEIKWRGPFNKSLCNKHAGKQGVGPNG